MLDKLFTSCIYYRTRENSSWHHGMNGVPRLQHLPVPAAAAGAAAPAVPEAGTDQRVKSVQPVAPTEFNRPHGRGGWGLPDEPEHLGDKASRDRSAARASRDGSEPAAGRLINFSRLTAMPFMVQVLGQQAAVRGHQAVPQTSLTGHRDAALLGSDLYRRAGGEPGMLPDGATFLRLAV